MYDFVDQMVSDLSPGSRFLVCSMRLWVGVSTRGQCPAPAVAPAFACWKTTGALPHFLRVMVLFNRDALETLRFCSLSCARVSEHEAIVLGLVKAMQNGHYQTVRNTLALLVEDDSIGDILDAIGGLASALQHAALIVSPPARAGARPAE